MLARTISLLALLLVAAPLSARAHDDQEWEEDYRDDWSDGRSDGYDVSVEVDASGPVNFDSFQGALSPYGEWVVAGGYGRVWRPRVASGWRPYYYGRWEWTNEGWLWVSDEPWGWAAYHYGRWTYDNFYGWVWVPGYQWAPAWVAWRYSGDVVGWAPLGPGISVYVTSYPFVDYWWTFVPTVRFVSVPVYTVAYAPTHTRRWFHETAPAPARPIGRASPGRPAPGRVPAWGGPAPRTIEERLGRPVRPVRVVAAPSPGAGRPRPGEVAIYRPEVRGAPGRSGFGERDRGPAGGAPGFRGSDRAERPGRGGEAFAPAPRGDRDEDRGPVRGGGRGPGFAPAPGRGGDRERDDREDVAPPPARGGGRGPGAAAPPGRPERGGAAVAPRGGGERGGAVAPRGNGGGERGGAVAPRGNGGRGRGGARPAPGNSSSRGERGGQGERGRDRN
jgi:hypothetical protein